MGDMLIQGDVFSRKKAKKKKLGPSSDLVIFMKNKTQHLNNRLVYSLLRCYKAFF